MRRNIPKQVVLIMTDTTRKDMVGCYGNKAMKTPNMDRLALEGLRFEHAYTCQPVCGPARSAIFTGMFPHTNGMVTNSVALGANVKTVGQRLNDYKVPCGYVGKWHLDGGDYFGLGTCPEGWDTRYWYDMRCYLEELSEQDRVKSRNPQTSYGDDFDENFTYAHRCSNRAIEYLNEKSGQSFFLTVSYDEPHGPSLCPKPYNTMYTGYQFPHNPSFQDDLSKKPRMQQLWSGNLLHADEATVNHASDGLALFLGCNSFVDYEIGRVLDAIDQKAPDALVIFTSDHGDMLGSHRLFSKNAAVYEEVVGIPLLIRDGCNQSHAGCIVDAPASHIDLAPTILDYFGLPIPPCMEGKSMLPQIREPQKRINDEVFTEFTRYEVDHDGFGGLQMMRGIVTDRYKLALYLLDTDELYDTVEDPHEIHNLIGEEQYVKIRNELHDHLLEHMNQTRDPYRGYQWSERSWRQEKKASWENDACTRQRQTDKYEPRQLDYDTGLPMESSTRKKKL